MLGQPDPGLAEQRGIRCVGQNTQTNRVHLRRLAELVDSGKIKVQVDKVFTMEQAREAFEYQEQGHPKGKVVVAVK